MSFFSRYILGILPGIAICLLFISFDKKRKKNLKKYLLVFLLSAMACIAANRLEYKIGSYFPEMVDMTWYMVFIYAIFGVAIFEEVAKWFVVLLISPNSIGKKEIFIFTVISAMGFATFENVVYYLKDASLLAAVTRAFLAVPSHACDGIIMGYFLYKLNKDNNKLLYLSLSLIIPILVHATYNAFLYKGIYIGYVINLIFYFTILAICIKIVLQNVRSVENE